MTEHSKRLMLVGVAASPGYAMGPVHLLKPKEISVVKTLIPVERIPREIAVFRKALNSAIRELSVLKDHVLKTVGSSEALIFDTHMMILQDNFIVDPIVEIVKKEKLNIRYAFHLKMHELIAKFEASDNENTREKAQDIKDIYNRVVVFLSQGVDSADTTSLTIPSLLIAHTLTPSYLMELQRAQTLGFASDTGGRTSHVSILARSMQIPAVSGLSNISILAEQGDIMIIDGTSGVVILNPDESDIRRYNEKKNDFIKLERDLLTTRDLDPITVDGRYIRLSANIELAVEADSIKEYGAGGIGLYRSEFLYTQKDLPSRREQTEAYRYVLKAIYPRTATIRTLDAGGDKLIPELSSTDEANPFMGWRSIRLCLDQKQIFKDQLRALLIASNAGKLRIMFPMISSLEELHSAKSILREVKEEMRTEGLEYALGIEVGIMIEVPSAVIMVKELAREVDFFSIGTNDLIQFTLAVDRSNEKIASMFQPHHPAVLRMLQQTIEAAHNEGIDISVCGEMASDPLSTLLLVGMGIDELSMSPWAIMECKKFIRSITFTEARGAVQEVLKMSSARDINKYLRDRFMPRIIELGISSFITKDHNYSGKTLVRIQDEIIGIN
jgi:phosphotransferase system enzyme I (PtsI)